MMRIFTTLACLSLMVVFMVADLADAKGCRGGGRKHGGKKHHGHSCSTCNQSGPAPRVKGCSVCEADTDAVPNVAKTMVVVADDPNSATPAFVFQFQPIPYNQLFDEAMRLREDNRKLSKALSDANRSAMLREVDEVEERVLQRATGRFNTQKD